MYHLIGHLLSKNLVCGPQAYTDWIVVPGDKIQWRKIQTYTACQSVDVVDYFDFKKYTPLQLLITTYRQENMGFSVYIEESIKVMFLFAKF